jgi:hypothetical protein
MTINRGTAIAFTTLICVMVPRLDAEEESNKTPRHHKVSQWLSMLSGDSREKLRNAKREALKDPAVQAAKARRDQAETEYRELLHHEMLKTDPSLKPLLEAITELKSKDDL